MSSNYLRVTSGREGTGVPSKCDWMKADSQELDLVDEDSEATVTKKAQEHHRRKQVRRLEAERLAWEAAEVAERHHQEEDAVQAALERSKAEMQEAAKAMRQGGARESESMVSHLVFWGSVCVLNWVQDLECQESGSGPMLLHPPCGWCTQLGTTCILPLGAKSWTCQGCRKSKVKCPPGKGAATMVAVPVMTEQLVSGEKRKGESSVVLLRKGEKQKHMKRVMADAASIKEIETALGGLMTAGPLQQQSSELVAEVLDQCLGELVKVID